jgi:hypothetical protein
MRLISDALKKCIPPELIAIINEVNSKIIINEQKPNISVPIGSDLTFNVDFNRVTQTNNSEATSDNYSSLSFYILHKGKNVLTLNDIINELSEVLKVDSVMNDVLPDFIHEVISSITLDDFQCTYSLTEKTSSLSGVFNCAHVQLFKNLQIRKCAVQFSLNLDRESTLNVQALMQITDLVKVVATRPKIKKDPWVFSVEGVNFSFDQVNFLDLDSTDLKNFLSNENSLPSVVVTELAVTVTKEIQKIDVRVEGNFAILKDSEYITISKPSLMLMINSPFKSDRRQVDFQMKFELKIHLFTLECGLQVKSEDKVISGDLETSIEKVTLGSY